MLVQEPSERGCLPLMFPPPAWLMSFPASFQEHDGNRKKDTNGGAKFARGGSRPLKRCLLAWGGEGGVGGEEGDK